MLLHLMLHLKAELLMEADPASMVFTQLPKDINAFSRHILVLDSPQHTLFQIIVLLLNVNRVIGAEEWYFGTAGLAFSAKDDKELHQLVTQGKPKPLLCPIANFEHKRFFPDSMIKARTSPAIGLLVELCQWQ